MQLLVNRQLIPIAKQPKSICFEQICNERSQGIAATSLPCIVFFFQRQKTKT